MTSALASFLVNFRFMVSSSKFNEKLVCVLGI